MISNDIHWFFKDTFSMNLNDVPLYFNCFHWFASFFICCSMLISLEWFSMFFIDFQWCSYVFHSFPIPFKILWFPLWFLWFSMIFIGCSMVLLIFTMILNGFHWFLIILICFSLFFQFTTSIWYRRRSAGIFGLPHVSFPTFNDMRACHAMPACH